MPLAEIAPPLVRPITLAQIKQHLRIDSNAEDEILTTYCDAATNYIEAYLSRFLINRTVRQYVDSMPDNYEIVLEADPVSAIHSVQFYDAQGNPEEVNVTSYRFCQYKNPPIISFDIQLPATAHCNGIEIDMVAGFGESGADLPQNIIRALLILIAHWYEYRGTNASGEMFGAIPDGIDKLLASSRRVYL